MKLQEVPKAAAVLALFLAGYAPTLTAQVRYELRAMNSAKCAHVQAASQQNGGRISLWTCNANQMDRVDTTRRDYFKWKKINAGGEWFKLQAVHSSKCAQVNGASHDNGAHITQWDCGNQNHFYWKQMPMADGSFQIVNRASGKCMHVHGGQIVNGAVITQWECVDQPNVKWNVAGSVRLSEPQGNPVQE